MMSCDIVCENNSHWQKPHMILLQLNHFSSQNYKITDFHLGDTIPSHATSRGKISVGSEFDNKCSPTEPFFKAKLRNY